MENYLFFHFYFFKHRKHLIGTSVKYIRLNTHFFHLLSTPKLSSFCPPTPKTKSLPMHRSHLSTESNTLSQPKNVLPLSARYLINSLNLQTSVLSTDATPISQHATTVYYTFLLLTRSKTSLKLIRKRYHSRKIKKTL